MIDDNDRLQLGTLPTDPFCDTTKYSGTTRAEGGASSDDAGGEWLEEPVELGAPLVPTLPLHALPEWLGRWVRCAAEEVQVPTDMIGSFALSALATAAQGVAVVEPRPGWVEPLNLFLASSAAPGSRKSAALRRAVAPLEEWERDEAERLRPTALYNAKERSALEGRIKALDVKAAKASTDAERATAIGDAVALTEKLEALEQVRARRLFVGDATPERLVGLLHENGGTMSVLSGEPSIVGVMLGRYNGGDAALEVFLSGHAGDCVRVSRMGREEVVDHPRLTLGLALQPDVLRQLGERSEVEGRGLAARFLFTAPPSMVGRRNVVDPRPMPPSVEAEYRRRLSVLLSIPAAPTPHRLRFSADALARFQTWHRTHEPRLGDGGDLEDLQAWGSKLPGALVRLAGLFHLAGDAGLADPVVGVESVECALRLAPYWEGHARAAFGLMRERAGLDGARAVLAWIQRKGCAAFRQREAQQSLKRNSAIGSNEKLTEALQALEDHGWVERVLEAPRPNGGRISPRFRVHPLALQG